MTYANAVPNSLLLTAGWTGIAAFVLTLPTIALYFVSSGAPTVRNVLARTVINAVLCCFLLLFVTTLSALVSQTGRQASWLAVPLLGAGLAFIVVTLVADAVAAGAVLRVDGGIDPTLMGTGGEASQVIYSPLARLLTALFLILCAAAAMATGALPQPLAYIAICVALFHLALVPTVFSTTDPSRFYSLNGWSIPIAGGLFMSWVLAAGIALLTRAIAGASAS